jgi:hypothetical protein
MGFLFPLLCSISYSQSEQVYLGTNSPDASALMHLDISLLSSPKGLLIPRMTTIQRSSIASPATGLMIFNTTTNSFEFNSNTPSSPTWTQFIASNLVGDATINSGTITLANSGVSSGTFGSSTLVPVIQFDSKGRAVSVSTTTISLTLNNGQIYIGNGSNQAVGVTMVGDASITNTGTITLANSGVTSGTYGSATAIPIIQIDSKGRVVSASSITFSAGGGGSGTTTLEQAYNGTGSGAGRTISVGSGAIDMVGSNASDYTLKLSNSANGGVLSINNTGSGDALRIFSGSNTFISVKSDGKVGIGTNSPNEVLTIEGFTSLRKQSTTPTNSTNYGKLYVNNSNALLFTDESGTATLLTKEYAIYRDSKSSGTDGGTFASGSWEERTLNSTQVEFGTSISRSGNTITLTAGTYRINAYAIASAVDGHKIRIFNKSSSTSIAVGSSEVAPTLSLMNTKSTIECIVTLTSTTEILLQHICNTGNAGDGRGIASNIGDNEIFAEVAIEKIR